MKSLVLLLATFVLGAALALVARTVLHDPHAAHPTASATLKSEISNPKSDGLAVVNTTCPICGMGVDPSLAPANYQGKLVGFGCAACPPRFAKDPERYGPSALRNEVAK